jgi:dTDP-4-amino-4,6-dideoxygalactose transaminase|uniref:Aminotransferase class I/classII domain-containing protein n=1 Tax=Calcidiscus leptoporus TaxID=127549 RepID=A0A7S0J175_9EUKA|mmetsp:Transcript_33878/g.79320  ORF Transcript_33878/g.79320 Transcript_33878/m.79320 type:complete len:445 (+) Transcript_33878:64-1398(+)
MLFVFLIAAFFGSSAAAAFVGSPTSKPFVRSARIAMIADLRKIELVGEEAEGPTFHKPLSTPDAVPEEGIARATELMRSGALFRYTPGVLSETALAERDMCEYTGFRYAVGFNSCGSALFIALKCAGVEPGDQVLCNAFSFTAVPSAVHHAGASPVYVECTSAYVMDPDDLRAKITPQTKYLMLTHMRGKVAEMDEIYSIAREHELTVIEDCAHALGIQWDGVQLGRSALAACYSSQSAKVINSGEGGFLCTDDDEVAARAFCYAGCYEQLYEQHVVMPPAEAFEAVKLETPNYSLRMSDLTASCVRPQIWTLDARAASYNERYSRIVNRLASCAHLEVPPISPRVRPICDSLQCNLLGMSDEQVADFLGHAKRRGMPVGLFGSKGNSRNFRTWQYAPASTELPATEKMIAGAIDVRLPLSFDESDLDLMADVLLAAVEDTMGR